MSGCAIMIFFHITHSQPPVLARGVQALSSGLGESLFCPFPFGVTLRQNQHHGASLTKRIFIEKDFVRRNTLGAALVGSIAQNSAAYRAAGSQQCRCRQSNSYHRSHSRQKSGCGRAQLKSSCDTESAAKHRAYRTTYTGLLGLGCRNRMDVVSTRSGGEKIYPIPRNAG